MSFYASFSVVDGFLYSVRDYRIRRNLALINLPDNGSVHFNFYIFLHSILPACVFLFPSWKYCFFDCEKSSFFAIPMWMAAVLMESCDMNAFRSNVRNSVWRQINSSDWRNMAVGRWHLHRCGRNFVPFYQIKTANLEAVHTLNIQQSYFNSDLVYIFVPNE